MGFMLPYIAAPWIRHGINTPVNQFNVHIEPSHFPPVFVAGGPGAGGR